MRQSLPESMQAKIAKEQRSRRRKDELAQKRRERLEAKRRQLKLDFAARPSSPEELAVVEQEVSQIFQRRVQSEEVSLSQQKRQIETGLIYSQNILAELPLFRVSEQTQTWDIQNLDSDALKQDAGIAAGQSLAGEERAPYEWERQDFQEWYGLAVRFKLVTDYQWRGAEYWVLVNEVWWGFCEMVGVFSGAWLRRYLGMELQ